MVPPARYCSYDAKNFAYRPFGGGWRTRRSPHILYLMLARLPVRVISRIRANVTPALREDKIYRGEKSGANNTGSSIAKALVPMLTRFCTPS
jgi:hypothetical protein